MDLALTADLGNSSLKLCAWDVARGAVVSRGSVPSGSDVERDLLSFLRDVGPFSSAALSSVGSIEIETRVLELCRAEIAGTCLFAPDCGLELDVREPDLVGLDRRYAARGALEHVHAGERELVVIDAGTALTVDAVRGGGTPEERGRFLGGAIAPGPALLARALADHTARLPLVVPVVDPIPLGRDTRFALLSGVGIGFRGSAVELARRVAQGAGFRAPIAVVTGGASAFLDGAFGDEDFARVVVDQDLVHRGLFLGLQAHLRR